MTIIEMFAVYKDIKSQDKSISLYNNKREREREEKKIFYFLFLFSACSYLSVYDFLCNFFFQDKRTRQSHTMQTR